MMFPINWIGRKDCDVKDKLCKDSNGNMVACSTTTGRFDAMPSADLTTREVVQYFADNFGFNTQETVAIMGGHNLGFASRTNSGYDGIGGWHLDPTALNRGYYAALNLTKWNLTFVNNSDIPMMHDKYQWNLNNVRNASAPPSFMLNADMAIVRDMEGNLNSSTGFVSCQFACPGCKNPNPPVCPYANLTFSYAVEYKLNETKFLYDFRDAFNKMLTRGYDTTYCSAGCPLE